MRGWIPRGLGRWAVWNDGAARDRCVPSVALRAKGKLAQAPGRANGGLLLEDSPLAGAPGRAYSPRVSDSDRDYCREILPRVSRTFAINIRLLDGRLGESVRIAYLLCRSADAIEDSWPGDAAAIDERFGRFDDCVAGSEAAARSLAADAEARAADGDDLDLLAHLPRVWRAFMSLDAEERPIVSETVRLLAAGMRRYAVRDAERRTRSAAPLPYLDDEAELLDYCWVVAGCIGVMLSRLFALSSGDARGPRAERRLELAPFVGRALQLTNILLDWPIDVRRGRCYVPAAWLREQGLSLGDLVSPGRPEVAAVAARLEALARDALARVPEYLDTIPSRHVRYRMFCLWPALWAKASLRHAHADPEFPWGERRPRLPRAELWRTALGSLVAGHHRASLERLYAASG